MNKLLKPLFTVTLGLTVFTAGCGSSKNPGSTTQGNQNAGKQAVEITYQSWITPNLTAAFYDNAIKKFQEKNPGIKVKRIEPPANEGSPDNYLKTLLAAGDFPDVVQNATIKLFFDADALHEIPIDADIKQINNYDSSMINGKLYNISAVRQPQSLMFYNKKMFADAGITNIPKTWTELEDASAKLKAKGFTPILTAGDWTAGFAFSAMASPTIYKDNQKWYTDRYDGKVKFTDPNWIEAANYFDGLVKKGYFNKGALSIGYTDVEQEFLKGNGAMYPMGVWFTAAEAKAKKDFEVGVFPIPTKDGKVFMVGSDNEGLFAVSKTSKQADAAIKFAKFMMLDPEVGKEFLKADALISNLKTPITYDMSPLQKELAGMMAGVGKMVGHYNNQVGSVPVSGIQDQYNKVAQTLLLGNAAVKDQMASLDAYWESHKK
ncbi:extracellular solute-binding protein [Paenibacillus sp. GP183]|uniref:ABC transporter substrate-binding protein n=1 Tax=Paenibacillus sp. GP183 TaxID=1882751 RepID=UPI0008949B5F|nr:extracellular solute-binding protein [Paenibacillus sp. GP183]SEB87105.1 carbohydrate ABC transporter substrate-binding protein, CUT1 family [Paenibacillus sp. GP183]